MCCSKPTDLTIIKLDQGVRDPVSGLDPAFISSIKQDLPMATQLVLIIGCILLACGSAGLFIVQLNNTRLRGLGWLGGAFASGSMGAFFLYDVQATAWINVILADVLILTAFVLLNVAFAELAEREAPVPTLGIGLLVLQAVADLWLIHFAYSTDFRSLVASLLIAVQVGQTTILLLRERRKAIRGPAWFSAILALSFMSFNILRSIAIGVGVFDRPYVANKEEIVTYVLYIAVALGMAFGFFWMTATILTSELEHMASTDPLTRVYNRRVFLEWCEKELKRAQRAGTPFSILMVDLDHFKKINDSFGHQAGDEVLCAVVEEIQDSVRGIDILGRWGGEEFAVLLPGATLAAACVVAQRIRSNIEKISLQSSGLRQNSNDPRIRVTASIGLAAVRGNEDSIADVMQRADSALYRAKAEGRNRVLSAA
jgi:diguanylate cyclase (GGDEF)-like protein